MKRPKGPELKMPKLKAPAFLADLYYDLRNRRLLPLIALVLVAIAAVPLLLGGSDETIVPAPEGESLASLGSEPTSKLTVVEATPGLRDYRKRLSHRSPTDPFKQRYTSLPEAAQVESTGAASSAVTATTEGSTNTEAGAAGGSEGSAPAGSANGGGAEGGGAGGGAGDGGAGDGSGKAPRLVQFVVDVQISHMEASADGGQKMSEPEVRRHVRPLIQLPGKSKPVLTTMGVNLHNGKVYFLVSNDVKSLDGEFACVTRTPTGTCELLEVQPGILLEATYGPEEVLYRFKVTKIDVAPDGRAGDGSSPRAAFVASLEGP